MPLHLPALGRILSTRFLEIVSNHVVVFNESHARALLREYVEYYNGFRTHLALSKDAPEGRAVELRSAGAVREAAVLGGLHHRYFRRAA